MLTNFIGYGGIQVNLWYYTKYKMHHTWTGQVNFYMGNIIHVSMLSLMFPFNICLSYGWMGDWLAKTLSTMFI